MESISRVTAIIETARDLTLEAATLASARRTVAPSGASTMSLSALKKLLDSRSERDVLEGLRRSVSMLYAPNAPSTRPLFSSVIKNVASPSLPIRKLVYIYLLSHAEVEPDLALLSINTIQKTLGDRDAAVRALALKVMSGLKVPVISAIVVLAIKRGVGDMSPLVRKAAALAIPKCYRLDPATKPQLEDFVGSLMADRQYYVAGPAVMAWLEVCPDRFDLVHPCYRALVRRLVDMDEWSQLATLRLMMRYARRCFPRRTKKVVKGSTTKGFYGDEEESTAEKQVEEVVDLDPDLRLLLDACKLLLSSRNAAVIVAVARCYLYLGTPEYTELSIGPLVSLIRSSPDLEQIALHDIVLVCMGKPTSFVRYASHFFIQTTDSPHLWRLKLEILTIIYPHCSAHMCGIILSELEHFSRGSDLDLVQESVRAIGRCAQNDPASSARCMRLLLRQISSPDGNLVAESLTVIRHLIQQDPGNHATTVIRLAKKLDTITSPDARASIIWLVGEFAGINGANNVAPDVLRILTKGFAEESEVAKLQIVLLGAKTYVNHINRIGSQGFTESLNGTKEARSPELETEEKQAWNEEPPNNLPTQQPLQEDRHPISLLWKHILLLSRYDTSYDLRDRARLYKALLDVPSSTQLASLMLLAPKPAPHAPSPSSGRGSLTLGSSSLVVGEAGGLGGYEDLPEWVAEGKQPDAKLREDQQGKAEYEGSSLAPAGDRLDQAVRQSGGPIVGGRSAGETGVSAKEKTLDDWLAEDEEGETESSDEEEEEEEETDEDDEEDSSGAEEQDRLVPQG
ncbi:MAG: AP-3 complex subunit beta [Vezdaea aestivalis]|nr:MAG: AP-3 complex subunit beta [Vezdaea aestivalis]